VFYKRKVLLVLVDCGGIIFVVRVGLCGLPPGRKATKSSELAYRMTKIVRIHPWFAAMWRS
jgi:hypothetical protein